LAGEHIAIPPAGHYQDDSVLTRLCYAKSFAAAPKRVVKPPFRGSENGKNCTFTVDTDEAIFSWIEYHCVST
ncbi:hypothetical protein, partial [Enterobacter hormaechei]|uniref:hypothetical protein n=1 Tax=Enterobacter hormaechei TaxID=158836 RepID=UPI001F17EECA